LKQSILRVTRKCDYYAVLAVLNRQLAQYICFANAAFGGRPSCRYAHSFFMLREESALFREVDCFGCLSPLKIAM